MILPAVFTVPVLIAFAVIIGCSLLVIGGRFNFYFTNPVKFQWRSPPSIEAFEERYSMREMTDADHEDIVEICRNVYGGNDYLPRHFEKYLKDRYCVMYGCADKRSDEIIATAAFQCDVDGGYTGVLKAVRVHPDHKKQGIAYRLIVYTMDKAVKRFPSMRRLRSTQHEASVSSTRLHNKLGFSINEITYPFQSTLFFPAEFGVFEQRMEQIRRQNEGNDLFHQYMANMQELTTDDIDDAVMTITKHFHQRDIFIQYDVYDMNITPSTQRLKSMDQFKSYLSQKMTDDSISVYRINGDAALQHDAAVCFECGKEWKFYHIYAVNETAILSMILQIKDLWKPKQIENKQIRKDIFVTSDVVGSSETLQWLFPNVDKALVRQKRV